MPPTEFTANTANRIAAVIIKMNWKKSVTSTPQSPAIVV